MSEWIKCSDRMPKGLLSILMYVKEKNSLKEEFYYMSIGHWDSLNKVFVSDAISDITPCEFDHDRDFTLKKSQVKFWMHLPKPPEGL